MQYDIAFALRISNTAFHIVGIRLHTGDLARDSANKGIRSTVRFNRSGRRAIFDDRTAAKRADDAANARRKLQTVLFYDAVKGTIGQ